MSSVLLAIEWLIGAAFVAAGALKLVARRQFVTEVADYRVVPRHLVAPVAAVLPALEIVAGAMIFVVPLRTVAAIILIFCLVTFTAVVVINLLRGRTDLACACFGRRSRPIDWAIPARNGLMTAALTSGLVVTTDSARPSVAAIVIVLLSLVLMWTAWEARALGTPIGGEAS